MGPKMKKNSRDKSNSSNFPFLLVYELPQSLQRCSSPLRWLKAGKYLIQTKPKLSEYEKHNLIDIPEGREVISNLIIPGYGQQSEIWSVYTSWFFYLIKNEIQFD